MVQLPIPRLPYGSRRRFRPEERSYIEQLIETKLSGAASRAASGVVTMTGIR